MQTVSLRKAGELPQRMKSVVEQFLGRPIDADEDVSVMAVLRSKSRLLGMMKLTLRWMKLWIVCVTCRSRIWALQRWITIAPCVQECRR